MNTTVDIENAPWQTELLEAARKWRLFANTARPEGLARVCYETAASLEREADDGIAKCVCCGKSFGRGMWG